MNEIFLQYLKTFKNGSKQKTSIASHKNFQDLLSGVADAVRLLNLHFIFATIAKDKVSGYTSEIPYKLPRRSQKSHFR